MFRVTRCAARFIHQRDLFPLPTFANRVFDKSRVMLCNHETKPYKRNIDRLALNTSSTLSLLCLTFCPLLLLLSLLL